MLKTDFKDIFRSVMPDYDINNLTESSQIGDSPEWDSISNLNLLLAIEGNYGIRFSIEEMGDLDSVAKLHKRLSLAEIEIYEKVEKA